MQDISEDKLPNAMRVCRTLQIISWYKNKVKAGADPDDLTLDLYWAEDKAKSDKSGSVPYNELLKRVHYLEDYKVEADQKIYYLEERCQVLEEQLTELLSFT